MPAVAMFAIRERRKSLPHRVKTKNGVERPEQLLESTIASSLEWLDESPLDWRPPC